MSTGAERFTFNQWAGILMGEVLDEETIKTAFENMKRLADGFGDWLRVYTTAQKFSDSESAQFAGKGVLALISTFKECQLLFKSALDYNDDNLSEAALLKMAGMAKDVEEWRYIIVYAPEQSELKKVAFRKIEELVL